jgi:hypothetical protein
MINDQLSIINYQLWMGKGLDFWCVLMDNSVFIENAQSQGGSEE